MAVERKEVSFTVDPSLEGNVRALQAEGWTVEEGKLPVITYQLIRQVPDAPMGVGKLQIDDSKIFVLKAGEQPPATEGNQS